jgi:hypothetical protein
MVPRRDSFPLRVLPPSVAEPDCSKKDIGLGLVAISPGRRLARERARMSR